MVIRKDSKGTAYAIVNKRRMNFMLKDPEQVKFWNNIDSWEPQTLQILESFLTSDNIFIDIGAGNGANSLYASCIGKQVFATEPNPDDFDLLLINTDLQNKYLGNKNIFITPFALSDEDKTHQLHISNLAGHKISSLIEKQFPQMENYKSASVITARLDHYILNQQIEIGEIGLIKINAFGSEPIILGAASDFIGKHLPPMFISFYPFMYEDYNEDMAILLKNVYLYEHVVDIFGKPVAQNQFIAMNNSQDKFDLVLMNN
jgi:FkbM family methyltransferase